MCILIVLRGVDAEYPIIAASNRDENRDRNAMPPGFFPGARRRMLSPRDRKAGGTWMAVSADGRFAGITNIAGQPVHPEAESRGNLPHLALDEDDLDAACAAIERELARARYNAFQLLLSDGSRSCILRHVDGRLAHSFTDAKVLVITNEHALGALVLPGLDAALVSGLGIAERFAKLAPLLLDEGQRSGHRVLKSGGTYGTVSSSLVAVHHADPTKLIWEYAAASPREVPYRSYGNLGRRLVG